MLVLTEVFLKPILIQNGYTNIKDYVNKKETIGKIFYKEFLDNDYLLNLLREVNVIISHCGAGIVIESIMNKNKPYIMPRKKILNEHVDDHQIELYDYLIAKKLAINFENSKNFEKTSPKNNLFDKNNKNINQYIINYINSNS